MSFLLASVRLSNAKPDQRLFISIPKHPVGTGMTSCGGDAGSEHVQVHGGPDLQPPANFSRPPSHIKLHMTPQFLSGTLTALVPDVLNDRCRGPGSGAPAVQRLGRVRGAYRRLSSAPAAATADVACGIGSSLEANPNRMRQRPVPVKRRCATQPSSRRCAF
jgi:hypothetical protein